MRWLISIGLAVLVVAAVFVFMWWVAAYPHLSMPLGLVLLGLSGVGMFVFLVVAIREAFL